MWTMMASLIWLAGCGDSAVMPDPDVVEAPVPVAEPVPNGLVAGSTAYVLASSLNLREAPKAGAALVGRLTVNSPLDLQALGDGWASVKVRNGKTGWVAAKFLATEPLTVEVARSRAQAAESNSEALSWWQRAAALDGGPEVLGSLAAAYEATGQVQEAKAVREQLNWASPMLFVHHKPESFDAGKAQAIWRVGYELGAERTIPPSKWAAHGLDASEPWWVLTAEGAAQQVKPTGFSVAVYNECAGDLWMAVDLDIPKGIVPLLAHRGAPPASWHQTPVKPTLSRAEAEAQIRGLAVDAGAKEPTVSVVAAAESWIGVTYWGTGVFGELGNELFDGLDVVISPDGTEVEKFEKSADIEPLSAVRDVTGDGKVEHVFSGFCESWVDRDGESLSRTAYRCCGC